VIAATVGGVRVVNFYVVNGEAVGSAKFDYKLRWLAAARAMLADELARHPRLVVLGDFNIAPADLDVHDPKRWREKVLCSTAERDALAAISALGLHDSFRLHNQEGGHHSWWDYRLAAFQRGWGLRIDLLLASEALRPACTDAGIDLVPRGWDRPSDHTPVWAAFDG
jgi:exodeoxyribonuclease-3